MDLQFFGGRGSGSGIKKLFTIGDRWKEGYRNSKEAEKILDVIQKSPVGTEVVVSTKYYDGTINRAQLRITGVKRNRRIEGETLNENMMLVPISLPVTDREGILDSIKWGERVLIRKTKLTQGELAEMRKVAIAERRQYKIKF